MSLTYFKERVKEAEAEKWAVTRTRSTFKLRRESSEISDM